LKPRRLISPPGTYFVTFSTWQRRRLFVVESNVRLFLKTLYVIVARAASNCTLLCLCRNMFISYSLLRWM